MVDCWVARMCWWLVRQGLAVADVAAVVVGGEYAAPEVSGFLGVRAGCALGIFTSAFVVAA